jgi:Spy/CpxP family protein refolding chaperone
MNKKIFGLILTVLVAAVFSGQALAWGNTPKDGRPPKEGRQYFNREKMANRLIKKLNLDDKQKALFLAQVKNNEVEDKAVWGKMKELRGKMEVEMKKDAPDQKTINSLIDETGKMQIEMEKKRVHSILELKKILTPEQNEKLKELIKRK